MSKKFEALRGMDDILPGEIEKWQFVEEKARIYFESRGYKEIRTPVLEYTDLFVRSVGESSDIVHKEMFSFEDRGGRPVTMRPEMTASVARAVIEKGLLKQAKSLRFYYIGPMFRAERPQAGRKRQFHQIGVELIHETGTAADFESIVLLYGFLKYLGIQPLTLKLNDLGSEGTRKKTAQGLHDYFKQVKNQLCPDCRWRLEKNVLRIFDCKIQECQPVIHQAPWEEIAPLSPEFEALTAQLKAHSIPYTVQRRLVRGLDYYNGAVFEISSEGLGAQDAIAGGGRYDRLYDQLGGTPAPCTGFSIGMERLLTALEKNNPGFEEKLKNRKVYLAPLGEGCELLGRIQSAALMLRERGIRVESAPGEISLSKHLKKANKLNLRYVLILGEEEYKRKTWMAKDLDKKTQTEVKDGELIHYFQGVLGSC